MKNIKEVEGSDGLMYPEPYFNKKPFTMAYDEVLQDTSLSVGARLLYCRLVRYAGKKAEAYPKMATMAETIGVSLKSAKRYIKELIVAGRIIISVPGNQHMSNRYAFPVPEKWSQSGHNGLSAEGSSCPAEGSICPPEGSLCPPEGSDWPAKIQRKIEQEENKEDPPYPPLHNAASAANVAGGLESSFHNSEVETSHTAETIFETFVSLKLELLDGYVQPIFTRSEKRAANSFLKEIPKDEIPIIFINYFRHDDVFVKKQGYPMSLCWKRLETYRRPDGIPLTQEQSDAQEFKAVTDRVLQQP